MLDEYLIELTISRVKMFDKKTGDYNFHCNDLMARLEKDSASLMWPEVKTVLLTAEADAQDVDDESDEEEKADTALVTKGTVGSAQQGQQMLQLQQQMNTMMAMITQGGADGRGRGSGGGGQGRGRGGGERGGRGGRSGAGGNSTNAICWNWRDTGACRFGEKCRFAHGQE
jgi:uncharacterized membrane protein YgcG